MGVIIALFLSAAFPVAVFVAVVFARDTAKEPLGLLALCFFLGCLSVIPVLIAGFFVTKLNVFSSPMLGAFYTSFVEAALLEEGFKFLFVYLLVWRSKEFDQHFDGIVYAVLVSLGFAFVENILYVFTGGFGVALGRAILAVPGHGFYGVVMGYFLSLARFSASDSRGRYLGLSLLVPIVLHGFYDFFLFGAAATNNALLVVLLLLAFVACVIVIWVLGIRSLRKHYKTDLYRAQEQAKAQAPTPYPVYPGMFDRAILVRGAAEQDVLAKLAEFGTLYRAEQPLMHQFRLAKAADWLAIKVSDTVSFFSFHQLVGLLGGTYYTIGLARNKTDPGGDYLFHLDTNRPYRDTVIGAFRNGVPFFVFLPQAYVQLGNLTISAGVNLSFDAIAAGLLSQGLDIAQIDHLAYTDHMVMLHV